MKRNQTKHMLLFAAIACLPALGLSGCGGGGGAEDPTNVALRPNKEPKAQENAGGGNNAGTQQNGGGGQVQEKEGFGAIKGRIIIAEADKGSLPPADLKIYAVGQAKVDPNFCARETPILNETLVVNRENMGLKNAFFYLERKPRGGKPEAASQSTWPSADSSGTKLVLDQKNCTFVPHAMIVLVGQDFVVLSQDAVGHTYKGSPPSSATFNVATPQGTPQELNPFVNPEKSPVAVSCATHNWMSGYQLPLDHPYGAVTDGDGAFTISDLPSGKHTFTIWHEKSGKVRDFPVTVKADETVDLGDITLRLSQLN